MADSQLKLVGLEKETKTELDRKKIYPRETYDDVVQRLLKENGKK